MDSLLSQLKQNKYIFRRGLVSVSEMFQLCRLELLFCHVDSVLTSTDESLQDSHCTYLLRTFQIEWNLVIQRSEISVEAIWYFAFYLTSVIIFLLFFLCVCVITENTDLLFSCQCYWKDLKSCQFLLYILALLTKTEKSSQWQILEFLSMQPLAAQQGSVECRRGCSCPSCDLILTGKKSGAVVVCCGFFLDVLLDLFIQGFDSEKRRKKSSWIWKKGSWVGCIWELPRRRDPGTRCTAPREWLPSWGKEQPAWLKWKNWAKLGVFSPSKGDVWPEVSWACCIGTSGAFEPLRTNLGEFQ